MQDRTIGQFLRDVSAKTPTPGGGSVAAVSAALGAGLGAMVARYSDGGDAAAAEFDRIAADLLDLARRDSEAYEGFTRARSLPKGTPEEKKSRSAAMQSALAVAASVPLETMRRCADGLRVLAESAETSNPSLSSDVGAAAWCLRAGLEGACLNVRINLSSLKDEARRGAWGAESDRVRADAEGLQRRVADVVERLQGKS